MKNIKVIGAFIAHLVNYAKAYASGATSLVAMLVASDTTHWPVWGRTTLYVVAALLSFLTVAVLPHKANADGTGGVTIGQAVAMDGAALAQARAVLKVVQLPGPVEAVLDKAEQVAPVAGAVLDAVTPTPVLGPNSSADPIPVIPADPGIVQTPLPANPQYDTVAPGLPSEPPTPPATS